MNKIAIYGDSFGELQPERFKNRGWSGLLSTVYNYGIDNYCFGGTSIEYSYLNFLKTHQQYNDIIFIASHIYRGCVFDIKHDYCFNTTLEKSINHLELLAGFGTNPDYQKHSKHIANFRDTTPDTDYFVENKQTEWTKFQFANELLKYNAIVSHIKLLRPDVKFIYSFNTFSPISLFNISSLDYKKFKTKNEDLDNRFNHFSLKQNQQLAYNMHLWLAGERDLNITLDPKSISNFYHTSETIQEAGLI